MTYSQTSDTIDTRISEVTVYTDRARVTRRGAVALSGEKREIAIARLPFTLQPESVRATGVGTVPVRLLGVRTERIYAPEPVADKVAQLTQEIAELESQKRTLHDQTEALRLQRIFVQNLGEKSGDRFSRSLAQRQISIDETGELLNFIGRQYAKFSAAIAQKEKQQQELDKQIEALRKHWQEIETPHTEVSWTTYITLEPASSGSFELELSYVVSFASWKPLYDLRVTATGEELNLTYLAEIQQNTREDWAGVALTLSTAKPGLGTLPPKLNPWYIDAPERVAFLRHRGKNLLASESQKKAEVGDLEYEYDEIERALPMASVAPKLDDLVAAESVAAAVSTTGGIVTFQVGGNSNIPTDNTPHKVTIFSDNYPGRPEYVAMPRLVSFAYLQTIVTNPATGTALLPGKANIFRDNTFVGTTNLENVSPGQEFKVNLGIDDGLQIQRDLVERKVDKKLISDQRRITYAYRVAIANLRDRETTLRLTEQLPVSRNEHIKVRLTQIHPKIQTGEMGVLEWVLTLPPYGKQEVYYQFVVEHPTSVTVVGLDI